MSAKRLSPYLTFNGNCREAMTFYQHCLGGELTFQSIGDSPLSNKMPEKMKNCILHATLKNDSLVLTGSDLVSQNGLIRGNSISLSLQCKSFREIKSNFSKLSKDGKINHPLENSFWGALFADITDKYGIHWLLSYSKI